MPSAAIIGGGITGLVTAYDLHNAGWQVTVYEASSRWGGKIWTSPVGERLVDAGPDTFLARVPQGKQLCKDLGLDDELVSPVAPVPAYFHYNGGLAPLPSETILGVPTSMEALASSGAVSAAAVDRAAQDLTLPATDLYDADGVELSVGAYCRARLGDEVTDRLIDPIIGGINASDIDRLSLKSGAPQLWAAANRGPSLIRGLLELKESVGATLGSAGADEPVFLSLPGGMARIVDALVDELGDADLRLNSAITDLGQIQADQLVLAVPSLVAGPLVAPVSPGAAELLGQIEYASVAQVTFEIPRSAVEHELDASGILFPRVDGKVITASTWFSTKWAHYQSADHLLIRLTSGRFGDTRALDFDDASLTTHLIDELRSVVDIKGEPSSVRVHRWIDALPQYTPGHGGRVTGIVEALAADAPTIHAVGASYRGIGIPACIHDGRSLAQELIAQ